MDTAKAEVLAFAAFPRAHWRKIWSTNPIERIHEQIKRRSRVVGIFPNNAAVIRLVGAILLDVHDEWVAAERRYLSEGSMAKLYTAGDNELVAALDSGAQAPRINLKAHYSPGLCHAVSAERWRSCAVTPQRWRSAGDPAPRSTE